MLLVVFIVALKLLYEMHKAYTKVSMCTVQGGWQFEYSIT